MTDTVQLRSIRVMAICGDLPEEQLNKQEFEIDMDLYADQTKPAISDDLNDAIDYTPICEAITNISDSEKFRLIERFAQRIVDATFEIDNCIEKIEITLKKLNPPVDIKIGYAAVHIVRSR